MAKFLNPFSIRCYKIFNSSLEEKLERCQEVKDIKDLVLPETAIVMDETTVGYTMEYNEGITFNKYYDQKTEEDHNNLHKELEVQRKINDIVKKLDTVDKLRNIKDGYFYVLNNFYFDLMDLFEDAILYKLSQEEYEDEMNNILDLFIEDMEYENIFIDIKVDLQPADSLTT